MAQQFKLTPIDATGQAPEGIIIDIGNTTFTTTSTSATFRTSLNYVIGGVVSLINDATIATDENVGFSIPTGAVSGGAITISRSSQGAASGASVFVILVGRQYDTQSA